MLLAPTLAFPKAMPGFARIADHRLLVIHMGFGYCDVLIAVVVLKEMVQWIKIPDTDVLMHRTALH